MINKDDWLQTRRRLKAFWRGEILDRCAIASQGGAVSTQTLLAQVRAHWAIEKCLHYVRDVSMGEDASQIRRSTDVGHGLSMNNS